MAVTMDRPARLLPTSHRRNKETKNNLTLISFEMGAVINHVFKSNNKRYTIIIFNTLFALIKLNKLGLKFNKLFLVSFQCC